MKRRVIDVGRRSKELDATSGIEGDAAEGCSDSGRVSSADLNVAGPLRPQRNGERYFSAYKASYYVMHAHLNRISTKNKLFTQR